MLLIFCKFYRFCSLVQDVFSITLFVQFGVASCIICVCLFKFTLVSIIRRYFHKINHKNKILRKVNLILFFSACVSCLLRVPKYVHDGDGPSNHGSLLVWNSHHRYGIIITLEYYFKQW